MTWEDAIKEIEAMHSAKQQDYGVEGDEYRNLRAGENYNVPAWVHACVMADHKSARIQSFVTKGRLENEGVRDSLLDRCVYSIAALVLFDESNTCTGCGASFNRASHVYGKKTCCPDCSHYAMNSPERSGRQDGRLAGSSDHTAAGEGHVPDTESLSPPDHYLMGVNPASFTYCPDCDAVDRGHRCAICKDCTNEWHDATS